MIKFIGTIFYWDKYIEDMNLEVFKGKQICSISFKTRLLLVLECFIRASVVVYTLRNVPDFNRNTPEGNKMEIQAISLYDILKLICDEHWRFLKLLLCMLHVIFSKQIVKMIQLTLSYKE